MNDYVEVRITASPCQEFITDLLAQMLADAGYESFVADEEGLTAYIPSGLYDEEVLKSLLDQFPLEVSTTFSATTIEGRDWNAEWERHYFQPILIGGEVAIHSSFHTDIPPARYDIVIDPKMAFGTGHHATTSLMVEGLLSLPLEGASVIDMGTGTGILALVAAMRGASKVVGIEIDPGAYQNACGNVAINHHQEIELYNGDAGLLQELRDYDVLLANINRNIITADIVAYGAALRRGGTMLLSGFYTEDVDIVASAAAKEGLVFETMTQRDNWACLRLKKNRQIPAYDKHISI